MDINNGHKPTGDTEPAPEVLLRRKAEMKLRAWEDLQPEILDPEKYRWYVHELRVHQFELEMQNEELRCSHEELEASQERFVDLYDFAPVGYVTISEAGIILEANRTATVLLRVAAATLVGQPISLFILPEDQDIYYKHRMAVFETTAPQSCKLRLLRTNQPPFWARLETAPSRDCGPGPSVCRTMLSDINDGVRLAAEKAQLEIQYRQIQKAESLGGMAGAIAHHFNNMLGVVLGNLELALDDLPKELDLHKYITSAMHAAQRAAGVSGSMLTYLGQSLGKHEPLNMAETCRASLPKILADIPEGVEMVVDFPECGPTINANAHQIQQILKNMVTNALEAQGDKPGKIHLTIKMVAAEDILKTLYFPLDWQAKDSLYACLSVTDNGCGIGKEDLDKIFDPFFTSKFFGRGLGLPIILGIARAHGGVVTVTSNVGQGTVVTVFIPISEGDVVLSSKNLATSVPRMTEGGTVLVVDDEPMLRQLALAALTSLGYEVLVANDGIEAVKVFQEHQMSICCVLCDLVMPGMDGWETLVVLRQLAPGIPVVMSSGYDQVQAMAGDHSEWPQFFLGKPYNLSALSEAIQYALAWKGKGTPGL